MESDLITSLKSAEVLGSKNVKYSPTCDNICDDFCNDCPGDHAMELKPYKGLDKNLYKVKK
ncbi:MAG: hypothetical protein ACP5NZ_02075 [Nanobdellota archaeon]